VCWGLVLGRVGLGLPLDAAGWLLGFSSAVVFVGGAVVTWINDDFVVFVYFFFSLYGENRSPPE